ncbi:hypothetical protein [Sediminicoccus rosea]|uniref:Uncharacterized protein n=1 Tax=Sediminicoccus rosea TaxID=1225128 RepID=A0ABZ0PBM2_9PROT|nr:hypothetical protein [Sediminicoccus rosea]WPB83100.1 hypothetical protein R9Z33_13395 [Sediminicoccus rosea]
MKGLDGMLRRLDRLEAATPEVLAPRPSWVPDAPVAAWPASVWRDLARWVAELRANGVKRPLAWMRTAELVAARDHLAAMEGGT